MCLSRVWESRRTPLRCRNHNLLAVARLLRSVRLCVADAVVVVRAEVHQTRNDQMNHKDRKGHEVHQKPDREDKHREVGYPKNQFKAENW